MRALIQDYLTLLKESDELDAIIPNLLFSMRMKLLVTPQKGNRQHGVDVYAVGIDPIDGQKKNFIITIKRGDIDRTIWSDGEQALRPTLEDIFDVYLSKKLETEFSDLPKKVVVCCGGELKSTVRDNWQGVTDKYNSEDIRLELWDGRYLSGLIEEHFLNEKIFFEDVRQKMRRTIVSLGDIDSNLDYFKSMITELFDDSKWLNMNRGKLINKALRTVATIPVCLGMVFRYSEEANNFKHPLNAAEYVLLKTWHFLRKNNLEKNPRLLVLYRKILGLYIEYGSSYFNKITEYCHSKDLLTRGCYSSAMASMVTFEQIGIFSSLGLSHYYIYENKDENNIRNVNLAADTVAAIIQNNSISGSPFSDEMTIDISLAIWLLIVTGRIQTVQDWFGSLIGRFRYAYCVIGKHFPISQNSLEQHIEFEYLGSISKEEMVSTSTLLPTLAYWCAILDFEEEYNSIVEFIEHDLKDSCDLQLWYPGKDAKNKIFSGYVAPDVGIADAPIYLPKSAEDLRVRIKAFLKYAEDSGSFELDWSDTPPSLSILSSRHFRNPTNPFMWLKLVEAADRIIEAKNADLNKDNLVKE